MALDRLQRLLDEQHVKYVTIRHSTAYTAQEIAALAHVPGKEMAKTVMVKIDGKMAMAVLPASEQVDLERLRGMTGAGSVALASEAEFERIFPGCEPGAMPPFGCFWNLDVYVAPHLAEDEFIAFNAGNHRELFKLRYDDFARLVHPKVMEFSA